MIFLFSNGSIQYQTIPNRLCFCLNSLLSTQNFASTFYEDVERCVDLKYMKKHYVDFILYVL